MVQSFETPEEKKERIKRCPSKPRKHSPVKWKKVRVRVRDPLTVIGQSEACELLVINKLLCNTNSA